MIKKYLPYLIIVAAAVLLFIIKKKQRGERKKETSTYVIPAETEPFKRDTTSIEYSKHALCRMGCRHIDDEEVKDILLTGKINYSKIEEDNQGVTYPLEGITKDKQFVRVVVAPKANKIVVVTVIDLETDWKCDCK